MKKNKPRVSIITVVLNGAKTIENAIKSVFQQSYDNIEYIVIDGLSTDGTQEIIDKNSAGIACYISESDSGIYDAMNKGIQNATGDIIGILNADDWYEKNAVEEAVSFFVNNPEYMVVAGRIVEHDLIGNSKISNIYPMSVIWKHMPFPHPAAFVRKKIYEKYGLYDVSYKVCADYDFVFRLSINNIVVKTVDCVWTNFCQGGMSTSNYIRTAMESNSIRKKYGEQYPNLIDKNDLFTICERELDYAYLLECYYRNKYILVDVLNMMCQQGVYIYGFGIWGRMLIDFCLENEIDVLEIFDQNPALWGRNYKGITISSPNEINMINQLLIAILYEGPQIAKNFYEQNKIICYTLDDISIEVRQRMGVYYREPTRQ